MRAAAGDARIVRLITPGMKKRFGAFLHVLTAFKVAMESHPLITVKLPDGEEVCGTQVILGNGKRYGGEAHLFAKLDYQLDGDYAGTLRPGETAVIEKLPAPLKVCVPLTPVPVTPIGRLMAHPMVEALLERIKQAQNF